MEEGFLCHIPRQIYLQDSRSELRLKTEQRATKYVISKTGKFLRSYQSPDCSCLGPRAPPTLPMSQHPVSAPWSCQSLPQRCHNGVGLQLLLSALSGHGSCQDAPICSPSPLPERYQCLGWAAPVSLAAVLLSGAVGQAPAARLCPMSL